MEWTTPQLEEVSLSCEINSYAKALKPCPSRSWLPYTATRELP